MVSTCQSWPDVADGGSSGHWQPTERSRERNWAESLKWGTIFNPMVWQEETEFDSAMCVYVGVCVREREGSRQQQCRIMLRCVWGEGLGVRVPGVGGSEGSEEETAVGNRVETWCLSAIEKQGRLWVHTEFRGGWLGGDFGGAAAMKSMSAGAWRNAESCTVDPWN